MPRAVITGGAGFIGSHLCGRLIGDGNEVVCLDNFLTGSPANVAHLIGNRSFRLIQVDVSEEVEVDGPVDAVLHLASPASPSDYLKHPIQTLEAGSLGTLNALELAKRKGARFVLASSSEIYGEPAVHPQPETYWGHANPIGLRGVYNEAKRFAEALTMAYHRHQGVDTAIARIFNTFGPGMRPYDGRAVPTFIRQALTGQPVTVTGDGSQTRSLCYVDDLVDGIVVLLASALCTPVNLGNPQELTILQLAELVVRLTGSGSQIAFIDRPVDDPTMRRPDISLAHHSLGWIPKVDVELGLVQTIDWFDVRLTTDDVSLDLPGIRRHAHAAPDDCHPRRSAMPDGVVQGTAPGVAIDQVTDPA